jgi:hypothetical protein|tara:strand:- start:1176 stop:1364 length:189 start_codon:yes stop_codon:yes gene_type:complete
MKPKELNKKLDNLLDSLRKANDLKDNEKIKDHVNKLNQLWEEASKEMLTNAKKEGFTPPNKN